jgi:hypothetical protein
MYGNPGPVANMDPTANGPTKVPFFQAGSTAADAAFGSLKQRGKSPNSSFYPQLTFEFPTTVPKVSNTSTNKLYRGLSLRAANSSGADWYTQGDLQLRGRSRANTDDVGLEWVDNDPNRGPWVRITTTAGNGGQSYYGVYSQKWYTLTAHWEKIGSEITVGWEVSAINQSEVIHKLIGEYRFPDLGLPWEEVQVYVKGSASNNQPLQTFTWYNV